MGEFLNNNVFLNADEAAALLQPHMRNKSALDWLANDRRKDPAIPFVILQGEPCYREADVVNFVLHVLNPSARFVYLHNQLNTERRGSSDRRRHGERRGKEAIQLRPGIERRRQSQPDRRLRGNSTRRALEYPC